MPSPLGDVEKNFLFFWKEELSFPFVVCFLSSHKQLEVNDDIYRGTWSHDRLTVLQWLPEKCFSFLTWRSESKSPNQAGTGAWRVSTLLVMPMSECPVLSWLLHFWRINMPGEAGNGGSSVQVPDTDMRHPEFLAFGFIPAQSQVAVVNSGVETVCVSSSFSVTLPF